METKGAVSKAKFKGFDELYEKLGITEGEK